MPQYIHIINYNNFNLKKQFSYLIKIFIKIISKIKNNSSIKLELSYHKHLIY